MFEQPVALVERFHQGPLLSGTLTHTHTHRMTTAERSHTLSGGILTGRPCRLSKWSKHFCRLVFSMLICNRDMSCTHKHGPNDPPMGLFHKPSCPCRTSPSLSVLSWTPTSRASGRPSSRRLSFNRLLIRLTVSSVLGLLLLLFTCCSCVSLADASLWSVAVLQVPADLSPHSMDCVNFSSE